MGVADVGKLPVDDGRQALGGDQQVADAVVAVEHRAYAVVFGGVMGEPAQGVGPHGVVAAQAVERGAGAFEGPGRGALTRRGAREKIEGGVDGQAMDPRELGAHRVGEAVAGGAELGGTHDAPSHRLAGAALHEKPLATLTLTRVEAGLRTAYARRAGSLDETKLLHAGEGEGVHVSAHVAAEHEGRARLPVRAEAEVEGPGLHRGAARERALSQQGGAMARDGLDYRLDLAPHRVDARGRGRTTLPCHRAPRLLRPRGPRRHSALSLPVGTITVRAPGTLLRAAE